MRFASVLAIYGLLSSSPVRLAKAQLHAHSGRSRRPLAIVMDSPSFEGRWRVLEATLDDDFQRTWAWLRVQSIGDRPASPTRFHAEYFDRSKRYCFSAVFVQYADDEQDDDSSVPGQIRRLAVSAPGLAPATEPAEVHLRVVDGSVTIREADFRAPITVLDLVPADMGHLPGNFAAGRNDQLVTSMALGEVAVDIRGNPTSVNVVRVRTPDEKAWFTQFLRNLRFMPQALGQRRESGSSLVLLQLVKYNKIVPALRYLPREDPWVREYVGALRDRGVPVISVLRFEQDAVSLSRWTYVALGTDWCPEVFTWSGDPAAGVPRREWATVLSRPALRILQ